MKLFEIFTSDLEPEKRRALVDVAMKQQDKNRQDYLARQEHFRKMKTDPAYAAAHAEKMKAKRAAYAKAKQDNPSLQDREDAIIDSMAQANRY